MPDSATLSKPDSEYARCKRERATNQTSLMRLTAMDRREKFRAVADLNAAPTLIVHFRQRIALGLTCFLQIRNETGALSRH
ncbi:hypothetical protein LG3211_1456 [Lysobacter gummosus]|nr:hypothetical protein LG3211_1456 [Lysobacter gummosus]